MRYVGSTIKKHKRFTEEIEDIVFTDTVSDPSVKSKGKRTDTKVIHLGASKSSKKLLFEA